MTAERRAAAGADDSRAIRISLVGASTFAVIGLSFALWSGSQAVLLDGAYNLISALMVLVAIRITTLLDHPGTPNRPVGYVALEPLYVLTKGLVLLALTLVVMASNLAILFSGGTELDLGAVVIYVALAVTGNLTVWLLIRRERRRHPPRCSRSRSRTG
ncbi:MAG: cation transporter [Actinomycetota bacterium]